MSAPTLEEYSHISTYDDAVEALGNQEEKIIANNTSLERLADNSIAVKLHNTDVIVFRPDGSITLDTGGYKSDTTKDRLNRYTPPAYEIVERNYEWFIETPQGREEFYNGYTIH